MVSVTQQTIASGNSTGQVTRPARALLGWLPSHQAQLYLAGQNAALAGTPELLQRANQARQAVQARGGGLDQSQLLSDVGNDLSDYLAEFAAKPEFLPFQAEGWSFKIADLSKVCALQPVVFWDHAEERTKAAVPGDMRSLAEITLPIKRKPDTVPLQFDQHRNTWMVVSRNPNLRIVAPFNAPIQAENGQEFACCGFLFSVSPSFVQVAFHRGRYVLRDGYHRSLGLLAQGMTHVPVLYRQFSEFEDLGIGPGMLNQNEYLGDRPPLLADYLGEVVSGEVQLPASQKMIVVQGMEMNPLG